jgi:hypothetical protein
MRLLLLESVPGNAAAIESELLAGGHEVVTCHDGHGGPCRGAEHHHDCPLEQHVDLAIVTRERNAEHLLSEMGSVCAGRHRVPVVEVDPSNTADDLPDLAVATALGARRVEAGYAQAVRQQFPDMPALVDVRREATRVVVTVQIPADVATVAVVSRVADRARQAVRVHDTFVAGIDINVVPYPVPVD